MKQITPKEAFEASSQITTQLASQYLWSCSYEELFDKPVLLVSKEVYDFLYANSIVINVLPKENKEFEFIEIGGLYYKLKIKN